MFSVEQLVYNVSDKIMCKFKETLRKFRDKTQISIRRSLMGSLGGLMVI